MNPASVIRIARSQGAPVEIGNHLPLTFICGPCQLESRSHALETAEFLKGVFARGGAGFIYKTSFD
jgi:2-dehydro-3-deoxyphosphooctonate aldolase (KDO 8-P synthase)